MLHYAQDLESLESELNNMYPPESDKDVRAMENLIKKQKLEFPKILKELKEKGKKVGHWAWWVWPTSKPGDYEPSPKTYIKPNLIGALLGRTNVELWTNIFIQINIIGGIKNMPIIDQGRIGYFIKEFLEADEFTKTYYSDFFSQVEFLLNLKNIK